MYMYLYNGTWEAPQGSCFLVLHSKHVAEACVGSHPAHESLQGAGWGDSEHQNLSEL